MVDQEGRHSMQELTIKTPQTIKVPDGTKIINNSDWITLARKNKYLYFIITVPVEDVKETDFMDENAWSQYTLKELTAILKL